ncbi:hypothetical protein [Streptomyces regalis]|uniref:hypothetical protein n=1 Tax=Streptomyces regalis TaxID=68262 RepID=UPI000AA13E9E|nr:hypothetical protein [Streptomyces regalis]
MGTPGPTPDKFTPELGDPDPELAVSMYRNDNCKFLKQQRNYEAREVKRYKALILLLSIATVIALIFLIVMAFAVPDKNYVFAVVAVLETLAGSGLTAFVIKQKNDRQEQLDKWISAVKENCPPPPS